MTGQHPWTLTRPNRPPTTLGTDDILTILAAKGADWLTRTRVEIALELDSPDTANEWLAAIGWHITPADHTEQDTE